MENGEMTCMRYTDTTHKRICNNCRANKKLSRKQSEWQIQTAPKKYNKYNSLIHFELPHTLFFDGSDSTR
jgi:hypothetical protein